jgi:hypothetical protein
MILKRDIDRYIAICVLKKLGPKNYNNPIHTCYKGTKLRINNFGNYQAIVNNSSMSHKFYLLGCIVVSDIGLYSKWPFHVKIVLVQLQKKDNHHK